MRRSTLIVIALIAVALAALLLLSGRREENFDARFERAEQRLEDMATSIESDLEEAQAER